MYGSVTEIIEKKEQSKYFVLLEAPTGFEPVITILQTVALPLGYGADLKKKTDTR